MKPSEYMSWSDRDRALAEGLLQLQDSTPQHGIPKWISSDPERKFVVDEYVDHAQEALDEAREEYSSNPGGAPHGLKLTVAVKPVPRVTEDPPSL